MIRNKTLYCRAVPVLLLTLGLQITSSAQDRLKTMPGYEQFQRVSKDIPGSVKGGSLNVKWQDGGKSFDYYKDGKTFRYDIATGKSTDIGPAPAGGEQSGPGGRRRPGGLERGRQFASAESPDKKFKAFYRDRNLWLSDAGGANEIAITTDGNEKSCIKYGVASWVYGEELDQRTAMWWSPNSRKIAFYRFDESPVPDYFIQIDKTKLQCRMVVYA